MSRSIAHFFQTEFMHTNDFLEKIGDYYVMKKKFSDELLQNALALQGVTGYPITPQTRILFREECDPNNPSRKTSLKMFVGMQLTRLQPYWADQFFFHDDLNKVLKSYLQASVEVKQEQNTVAWQGMLSNPTLISSVPELIIPHPECNAPDPIKTGTATAKQLSQHMSSLLATMDNQQFDAFLKMNGELLGNGEYGSAYRISKLDGVEMQNPIVIKVFHKLDTTPHYCAVYAREWNLYYQDFLGLHGYACANGVQLISGEESGKSIVIMPLISWSEILHKEDRSALTVSHHRWGKKSIADSWVADNVITFQVDGETYHGVVDFDQTVHSEFGPVLPPQTQRFSDPPIAPFAPYPYQFQRRPHTVSATCLVGVLREASALPVENKHASFSNFQSQNPTHQQALQRCEAVFSHVFSDSGENKSFWNESLSFETMITVASGQPGSGKTHIATSLAQRIKEEGGEVLFIAPPLKHFSPNTLSPKTKLVIFDDVVFPRDAEFVKEWLGKVPAIWITTNHYDNSLFSVGATHLDIQQTEKFRKGLADEVAEKRKDAVSLLASPLPGILLTSNPPPDEAVPISTAKEAFFAINRAEDPRYLTLNCTDSAINTALIEQIERAWDTNITLIIKTEHDLTAFLKAVEDFLDADPSAIGKKQRVMARLQAMTVDVHDLGKALSVSLEEKIKTEKQHRIDEATAAASRVKDVKIEDNFDWSQFKKNHSVLCTASDLTAYCVKLLSTLPTNEKFKATNFMFSYTDNEIPGLSQVRLQNDAKAIYEAQQPHAAKQGGVSQCAFFQPSKSKPDEFCSRWEDLGLPANGPKINEPIEFTYKDGSKVEGYIQSKPIKSGDTFIFYVAGNSTTYYLDDIKKKPVKANTNKL